MTIATNYQISPSLLRSEIRNGKFKKPTSGFAPGHIQTNVAILPKKYAFDFLLFCQRNPKPCPIIEVLEPGKYEAQLTAPNSDIRSDVPLYRVYEHGILTQETNNITNIWTSDLVTFLLGCSFSFESALKNNGINLAHIKNNTNVSMYITNIPTSPAGMFSGPMVVSMRPIPNNKVIRSVQVTSRFPEVHGAPIHIGNPELIGIDDIYAPHFGDAPELNPGDVPVFWACGVTPQAIAMNSKPSIMITHSPGHMFVTDKMDEDYSIL
jgi:uncharacterized protein YcsI (UPF0317 family)